MHLFLTLQPLFIILSALLGIVLGSISPSIEQHAAGLIEVFLMIMLFFTFLGLDMREIARSFTNLRFSLAALGLNFLWTPVFAFLLATLFLPGQLSLQAGFIMLMVTPCTDWYLIFTGLARGNVGLGSSILPLNLILQILLLPLYLLIFMGRSLSFDGGIILQSVLFVLLIPGAAANGTKALVKKLHGEGEKPLGRIIEKSDALQCACLCLAMVSMFASQTSVLAAHAGVFAKLLAPLLGFFAVNFCLSLAVGKALRLPFADRVALLFTGSARNSPISLAIAVISFPADPLIPLVLVLGPLIELPVLAIDAAILRGLGSPRAPRFHLPNGQSG